MKRLFIFAILAGLVGCTKNTDSPMQNSSIYISGYQVNPNGILVAKYWKNGKAVPLTDGTYNSAAIGIGVTATDVIAVGYELSGNSFLNVGRVWQNGTSFTVNDCIGITAMTLNGSDLYFTGVSSSGLSYWKNESPTTLSNNLMTTVSGIAVDGTDIFVCGYDDSYNHSRAGYWKNGQALLLSDKTSKAYSVNVYNHDVYVAGFEIGADSVHEVACYWKNNEIVKLSDGTKNAWLKSVFVSGADIYAVGAEEEQATYWKNGIAIRLSDGSNPAEALAVAITGNDIHICGYDGPNAMYWKNGVAQPFTDGTVKANANFITVK